MSEAARELYRAIQREVLALQSKHPAKFLARSLSADAMRWRDFTATLERFDRAIAATPVLPQQESGE